MGAAIGTAAIGGLSGYLQGKSNEAAAESQAKASKYGADVSEATAKRNLAAEQALTGYTSAQQEQMANAYRSAYGNTQNQYGQGENKLAAMFAKSPQELETLKKQILTGQAKELQQGTSQLNAGLAQQGVRGGQAATQLRRGVGEMTQGATENIQNIISNEAVNRAGEQRQYTAGQQSAMQNFMLNPQSAQYSQQQTPAQTAALQELMKKYMAVGTPEKDFQDSKNKYGLSGLAIRR